MRDSKGNQGIQVFGGSLTADSVAAGEGARATSVRVDRPRAELEREVAALRAAIERHAAALADSDEAIADARRLDETLAAPEPDRSRVEALLTRLRKGAGQVADIATSLATIETLAGKVL